MVIALDCETPDLLWDSPVIGFSTYDETIGAKWWPRHQFDFLRMYLEPVKTIIMHNAKFDLQKMVLEGMWPKHEPTVLDTEAMAHLLDEHQRKGLKTLAKVLLGEETDEAEKLKEVRKELGLTKADGFAKIPEDILIPYALKDAEYTYRLYQLLWPKLEKFPELLDLFWKEMELTFALLTMEAHGMAVDVEYLEVTAKKYAGLSLKYELELRDLTGDEEFNPRSPKQVLAAFEREGITLAKVDKDTLKLVDHPLAGKMLDYRTAVKLHNSYLEPMLEEQVNGLLHVNIRQHGTVTGRVSSGEVDRE